MIFECTTRTDGSPRHTLLRCNLRQQPLQHSLDRSGRVLGFAVPMVRAANRHKRVPRRVLGRDRRTDADADASVGVNGDERGHEQVMQGNAISVRNNLSAVQRATDKCVRVNDSG